MADPGRAFAAVQNRTNADRVRHSHGFDGGGFDPSVYDQWLETAVQHAEQLRPVRCNSLAVELVSTHVNSPRHGDPQRIEPIDEKI